MKRHMTAESLETDEWALWAFGDTWLSFVKGGVDPYGLMNAWNEIHSDLHVVEEGDHIQDSLNKMVDLFNAEREEPSK